MQSLMDVEFDQEKNLLEVSTESDWSGAGDMVFSSSNPWFEQCCDA